MTTMLLNDQADLKKKANVFLAFPERETMYSGRAVWGLERHNNDSARGTIDRGPGTNDNGQGRYLGVVAPQSDTNSRRRSMTIQDMLNPLNEDAARSPQYSSSQSSEDEGKFPKFSTSAHSSHRENRSRGFRPHSDRVSKSPRPGARFCRPSTTPSAKSQQGKLPRSPDVPARSRPFRPSYSREEVAFIWYLRIDRGYLWPDIRDAFNARFARSDDERREVSGLQCRYYRLVTENEIPQVRNRRRDRDVVNDYGYETRARTGRQVWYPWLNGELYPANAYGERLD